jgi:hypothetical protein
MKTVSRKEAQKAQTEGPGLLLLRSFAAMQFG